MTQHLVLLDPWCGPGHEIGGFLPGIRVGTESQLAQTPLQVIVLPVLEVVRQQPDPSKGRRVLGCDFMRVHQSDQRCEANSDRFRYIALPEDSSDDLETIRRLGYRVVNRAQLSRMSMASRDSRRFGRW